MISLGKKFNRWTVIKKSPTHYHWTNLKYICRCDCGNKKEVCGNNLSSGKSKSCGCLRKEINTKHGMGRSPENVIWGNAIQRCTNPKNKHYKNYGGRGITVHPDFLGENGFKNFFKEIGKRPNIKGIELDRRNNDGNYEPGNLRWATRSENNLNKRNSKRNRGVKI
jgi:hypothetical protein